LSKSVAVTTAIYETVVIRQAINHIPVWSGTQSYRLESTESIARHAVATTNKLPMHPRTVRSQGRSARGADLLNHSRCSDHIH